MITILLIDYFESLLSSSKKFRSSSAMIVITVSRSQEVVEPECVVKVGYQSCQGSMQDSAPVNQGVMLTMRLLEILGNFKLPFVCR